MNPLAEDKVYIVWTIDEERRVSEVLETTQNYLHAQVQAEYWQDHTGDAVYVDTVVLGMRPVLDTEKEWDYRRTDAENFEEKFMFMAPNAHIERGM